MTTAEDFYVSMSNAIKIRDHAKAMIERWNLKVKEAEETIEGLIATQHVDETEQTPTEV